MLPNVDWLFGGFLTHLFIAVLLIVFLSAWSVYRPTGMPPGPRGYPVVGSLFSLSENMHLDFIELGKKYGDIFTIKLGSSLAVVLNNYELIKEALVKKPTDFAGRPRTLSGDILTEGRKDIAFSDYSPTWKLHRKISHQAIRAYASGEKLECLLREQAFPLLQKVLEESDGKPIQMKRLFLLTVNNIIGRLCFGYGLTLEDEEFKMIMRVFDEFTEIVGNGLITDVFPFMRYIPMKATRDLIRINEEALEFFKTKFRERKENYDKDNVQNLTDYLIHEQMKAVEEGVGDIEKLTDTHLIQTIGDLYGAGVDSTTETMDWSVVYMIRFPDVQTKVAMEIDDVVGRDRLPLLSDRSKLPYCDAVIHELMRIRTVAPLSVPHKALVDSTIGGYNVPKDTWVFINLWAVHMDKKAWENPDQFKPERFLEEDGSLKPKADNYMPFSAGRRVCLGESLAKPELFLLFTALFQRFTFSPVPGRDLPSLEGNTSVFVIRANKCEVVMKRRY
ncbi:steroid 17-alpha-hydroxylase/17,20 lyase-like [Ptychodera flava]|uniref:steroid 17-alpha-hydroxylase/17,20 lyase-like n=1 Tax=Ptychodera flava TaxID=63121 RepID=UPI00396A6C53